MWNLDDLIWSSYSYFKYLHCDAFGLLGAWQALPFRDFKPDVHCSRRVSKVIRERGKCEMFQWVIWLLTNWTGCVTRRLVMNGANLLLHLSWANLAMASVAHSLQGSTFGAVVSIEVHVSVFSKAALYTLCSAVAKFSALHMCINQSAAWLYSGLSLLRSLQIRIKHNYSADTMRERTGSAGRPKFHGAVACHVPLWM